MCTKKPALWPLLGLTCVARHPTLLFFVFFLRLRGPVGSQVQENPMILGPEETIFENLVYGFKVGPSLDMKALEERCIKVERQLAWVKW